MKITKSKLQIFVTLYFLAFVGWWISFQSIVQNQSTTVQWFGGAYGTLALIGSLIGLVAANKWGGIKTVLGKSLTFFSLGLMAQEAGQLIYTYYVYGAKTDIPYPSLGDIAYFGSVILYIFAALFLAKAMGTKFSMKNLKYKVVAVFIPFILLVSSYWFLLHNHQYDTSHPVTVFLDFGYPMGQAIYISIAITAYLLSRKMLGGVLKSGIVLVIFALVLQYIADFNYIYQASRGTSVPGQYADLLYLISYFAMSIAMIKFISIYNGLRAKTSAPAETAGTSAEKEEASSEKEA